MVTGMTSTAATATRPATVHTLPAHTPRYPTCRREVMAAPAELGQRIRDLVDGLAVPSALGELTVALTPTDRAAHRVRPVGFDDMILRATGTVTIRGRARAVTATITPGSHWDHATIALDGRYPRGSLEPLVRDALIEAVTTGPAAGVLAVAAKAFYAAYWADRLAGDYLFEESRYRSARHLPRVPRGGEPEVEMPWPGDWMMMDAADEYWTEALAWFAAELDLAGGNPVAAALVAGGWHGSADELWQTVTAVTA